LTEIHPQPERSFIVSNLYTLQREQWIPKPLEEVFPFFASTANLSRITPEWLHFEVISQPEAIQRGTKIDYRLRVHGLPVRWQSEITVWKPPLLFVDEQRRGPYRTWIHEHRFEPRDGGTLVTDTVRYAVLGGALIHHLLVSKDLDRIFNFRQEQLEKIFAEAS
jgi:ligand-binding SRPBCC domain-containing protein